jgi:hypothetical protein
MAYFPAHRLLYGADLVFRNRNPDGTPAAGFIETEATDLRRAVAREHLAVDSVFCVQNYGPFSWAEFTASDHAPPETVNAMYPVVSVDSRAVLTDHFVTESHVERTLSRGASDTVEHESVVTTVDEIVSNAAGRATIARVTTGHYAGGDYYDSVFVDRTDLHPLREHMAYLQRKLDKSFDYDLGRVHQVTTSHDSVSTIERRYDVPVFAFSEIEMLVRSLPYHDGYTAILPLYSEGDDAIEMDSVSLIASRPERWTIRFADPAIVAIYGIEPATRRIVSWEVTNRKTNGKGRKIYQAVR